jgi:hypothetical protein
MSAYDFSRGFVSKIQIAFNSKRRGLGFGNLEAIGC